MKACKFCNELKEWQAMHEQDQYKVDGIQTYYKVALVIDSFKDKMHKGRITCRPHKFKYCPECGRKLCKFDMRLLKLNELNNFNGIPLWLQSTEEWLKVHEDCNKVARWFIPKMYNNHCLNNEELPQLWTEDTYGKYWNCYEKIL